MLYIFEQFVINVVRLNFCDLLQAIFTWFDLKQKQTLGSNDVRSPPSITPLQEIIHNFQ